MRDPIEDFYDGQGIIELHVELYDPAKVPARDVDGGEASKQANLSKAKEAHSYHRCSISTVFASSRLEPHQR